MVRPKMVAQRDVTRRVRAEVGLGVGPGELEVCVKELREVGIMRFGGRRGMA